MTKNHIISFIIFAVTYFVPFRYAVIDVDADKHAASALGVLFSSIGILAGIYYLLKNDGAEKSHESSSHH
ncbi:MAG: hypothetical protein ACLQQ4_08745 [Bacteroidia bacterium]